MHHVLTDTNNDLIVMDVHTALWLASMFNESLF